jgi:hypothetical protein
MAPNYLASKLLLTSEATTRVLRNADDFRLPNDNKSYTQNSLWHAGLDDFNKLPITAVKQNENLNFSKKR